MPPPERVMQDKRRERPRLRRRSGTPPDPMFWRGEEMFADRRDAGQRLAASLATLRDEDVVVLGIPRGGVEVAAVVAEVLDAPLDIVVPRKVGAPGNPELGLGAVAEDVEVLDEHLIRVLDVGEEYLRQEIAAQREEIARRSSVYRSGRPPVDLQEKVPAVGSGEGGEEGHSGRARGTGRGRQAPGGRGRRDPPPGHTRAVLRRGPMVRSEERRVGKEC